MTDHDDAAFAAGLRAAVAPDHLHSTLDAHRVLTSSRRAQRRRRTAALSATAGCAAAVGLLTGPLSPRTGADDAPSAAASGSTGAAGVVEVAPGVTAAADPRVHDRAGGGVVVDLGLPTWEPGTRFLLTVEPGAVDLPLRVWAGDDADLETLLSGAELPEGPVVESRGDLALVTGPDGSDQLAAGLVSNPGTTENPTVATVVARETLRGPEGEARVTLDLPVSPLAAGSWGGIFAMRVAADARTDLPAPAVRGVFVRDEYGRNAGYGGCDTDPDPEACATVWDAAEGSRAAVTRSSALSADDAALQAFADDYVANDIWASPGDFVATCRDERRALDAARGITRDDEDDLTWQCEADDMVDWLRWADAPTP